MALSRIVMRLTRNPGTEFSDGDDHRGYTITAPLTAEGMIDEAAFDAVRDQCTVRRFAPDDVEEGMLRREGDRWFVDYEDGPDDDQPVLQLGRHSLNVGDYVSIADEDGRLLAYKVTDVTEV